MPWTTATKIDQNHKKSTFCCFFDFFHHLERFFDASRFFKNAQSVIFGSRTSRFGQIHDSGHLRETAPPGFGLLISYHMQSAVLVLRVFFLGQEALPPAAPTSVTEQRGAGRPFSSLTPGRRWATRGRGSRTARVNDSFSEPGGHQTRGPPTFRNKTRGPDFETRGSDFFKPGGHFSNQKSTF